MYWATTTRCGAVRCAVMQWERLTGRERVASVIAGQRPSVMYDGMRMLCRPTYSAARPAGRERCGRGAGAVTACGDQECCGPVGWAVHSGDGERGEGARDGVHCAGFPKAYHVTGWPAQRSYKPVRQLDRPQTAVGLHVHESPNCSGRSLPRPRSTASVRVRAQWRVGESRRRNQEQALRQARQGSGSTSSAAVAAVRLVAAT